MNYRRASEETTAAYMPSTTRPVRRLAPFAGGLGQSATDLLCFSKMTEEPRHGSFHSSSHLGAPKTTSLLDSNTRPHMVPENGIEAELLSLPVEGNDFNRPFRPTDTSKRQSSPGLKKPPLSPKKLSASKPALVSPVSDINPASPHSSPLHSPKSQLSEPASPISTPQALPKAPLFSPNKSATHSSSRARPMTYTQDQSCNRKAPPTSSTGAYVAASHVITPKRRSPRYAYKAPAATLSSEPLPKALLNDYKVTTPYKRPMVPIMPDVSYPLCGRLESLDAYQSQDVSEVTCSACQSFQYCVQKASMFLCPACQSISPNAEGTEELLGLGLTLEVLSEESNHLQ